MSGHSFPIGITAALAAVLVAPVFTADRSWIETRSPHFLVAVDSDEKTARELAWEFEQVRAALSTMWPWMVLDIDRPFTVLGVHDEQAMKVLAPMFWERNSKVKPTSLVVTAPDRHYALTRTDLVASDQQGMVNPNKGAYWSYGTIVVGSALPSGLPPWVHRGLAGLVSNIVVRDKALRIGTLLPDELRLLRTGGRFQVHELIAMERTARVFNDEERLAVFDAEAWALVHYFLFGENGARRAQFDDYIKKATSGTRSDEAFKAVFGGLDTLDGPFARYLQLSVYQYGTLPVDAAIRKETFATRVLPAGESAALKAGFHAAMRRPVEARALLAEARKAQPQLAAADEVEALLADAAGSREEARAAYQRAFDAGSSNFYVKYRWATAAVDGGRDTDRAVLSNVERVLDETTRSNKSFAPAFALLAYVKQRMGKPEEAVSAAARAVTLDPASSSNHASLAQALLASSRRDDARLEADRALALAASEADRERARQVIAALAQTAVAPAAPTAGEASRAPDSGAANTQTQNNTLVMQCQSGDLQACATVAPVMSQACEAGTFNACGFLAYLYNAGRGVAADPARAAALYGRSCENGARVDCVNLAMMQAQGRGVSKNEAKAVATLQSLCEQGTQEACATWGILLVRSRKPDDSARGRELLSAACDKGVAQACAALQGLPK